MNVMKFKCIFLLFLASFLSLSIHAQEPQATDDLTLDAGLQELADRLLEGKQGSIVMIEPATGEVKCMAFSSYEADTLNRAIGKAYAPGSTFKVANMLTFLSTHSLSTETRYTCNEGFWRGKFHIGCHRHRSPLALVSALSNSCNSYFCKAFMDYVDNAVIFKSRHEAMNIWHSYIASMGLGSPLGIDMAGEVGGNVPSGVSLDREYNGRWNSQTIMWLGMGQGEVTVTPLQLCNLAAMMANRGWFLTPHIHKPKAGEALDARFTERHVCKADSDAYTPVLCGMRLCTLTGTASSMSKPVDFHVCGKTGTAENYDNDHSVFIGFAPMDKPRIAVCVYIEHGGFGADMAAPMAGLMIERALTGKLSPRSEAKVRKWQDYMITPPESDEPKEVKEEAILLDDDASISNMTAGKAQQSKARSTRTYVKQPVKKVFGKKKNS